MRLQLIFLMVSSHIVCVHGNFTEQDVDYSLSCVSDFLYSINCTMSISPKEAHVAKHFYWLEFQPKEGDPYVCMLIWMDSYFSCSFDTLPKDHDEDSDSYTFTDTDGFKITLYHNSSDVHIKPKLLDRKYKPVKHIKPKTPCNLTVTWTSSQYHFTWKSNYEEGLYLNDNLMYELLYHRTGDQDNLVKLSSVLMNLPVDDHRFEPDSEYTARIRSSPIQNTYKGQWSEWASAVHWKTDNKLVVSFFEEKFIILICVLPPMLLLLCYIPVLIMRKRTSIPSPAPYFQSLYHDCEGDFKTWVVAPSNECNVLKTEDTLQIYTIAVLDKDTSQLHSPMVEDSASDSPFHLDSEATLLVSPPAGSPAPPLPAQRGPVKSLTLISDPESSQEEDSGCWLCSTASLEQETPWYSNEYCTLNDTLAHLPKVNR